MDVLSTVLRDMRLESAGYRMLVLGAPWGISFAQKGLRGIHIVVEGHCQLGLGNGSSLDLGAGDMVVLPREDPHVLRAGRGRGAAPVPSFDLLHRSERGVIRYGGKGVTVRILCGAFVFHEADAALLSALPHVIRVPGGETGPAWLGAYVAALTHEAAEASAGSDIVMARLSDALVARALRYHAEREATPGWLGGLTDPQVATALGAIHGDPAHPWTLAELARRAGASRATFAARFAERVGEPPMQYLGGVRMRRAMRLLGRERATLARVAEAVGYGSEAAFSAAFRRYTGEAPGAYSRKTRNGGGSGAP